MTPPSSDHPELLLRKPGTIITAQVMLWLQFSFLLCCGTGASFIALFFAGVLPDIGIGADYLETAEDLLALGFVVVAAVIATVILLGVLAAKIGAGRRWAQVTTIVVMLVAFVLGFVGVYSGFELSEEAGTAVDGSRLVGTLASIAMPAVTLICLFTGSANQWFRQGGKEPLRRQPPQAPQPYSPY